MKNNKNREFNKFGVRLKFIFKLTLSSLTFFSCGYITKNTFNNFNSISVHLSSQYLDLNARLNRILVISQKTIQQKYSQLCEIEALFMYYCNDIQFTEIPDIDQLFSNVSMMLKQRSINKLFPSMEHIYKLIQFEGLTLEKISRFMLCFNRLDKDLIKTTKKEIGRMLNAPIPNTIDFVAIGLIHSIIAIINKNHENKNFYDNSFENVLILVIKTLFLFSLVDIPDTEKLKILTFYIDVIENFEFYENLIILSNFISISKLDMLKFFNDLKISEKPYRKETFKLFSHEIIKKEILLHLNYLIEKKIKLPLVVFSDHDHIIFDKNFSIYLINGKYLYLKNEDRQIDHTRIIFKNLPTKTFEIHGKIVKSDLNPILYDRNIITSGFNILSVWKLILIDDIYMLVVSPFFSHSTLFYILNVIK